MSVFQKIFTFVKVNIFSHFCLFNVIKINEVGDFKYLKSLFHFSFLVYSLSKPLVRLSQRGMLLLEIILVALFLGAITLSTSYYFTQTQATLSSSSQMTSCQNIVKQALESTVSLGTRLYGYKINHRDSGLRYTPLFIKKDSSKSWDVDGNIEDVNDGSELSFPPQLYKTLYKNLGISASSKKSPEDNTGKALIGDTYPYDISTSTLLVNSVNALQYLYNLDNGFFTANSGKGKKYTTSTIGSGNISSLLKKYERQFDLEDIEFYIKISPIDLQTNKVMTSPPSQILTRPHFHNPNNVAVTPALNVLGDDNIGFEIKTLLKYKRTGQEYECEGSHRFTHQIKPITRNNRPLSASLTGLVSGASKDFLTDSTLKNTSCDTDGTGYDDITVTVDFSKIEEGQQLGTVILCRMSSYCRSYGDGDYGSSCSPEKGHWQRCDDLQPKPSSDQSWTYKSKLKATQELVMTFEDMKVDRRYELDIGEFSIAGYDLRFRNRATFFIDAKRPHVVNMRITNDAVGKPKDGREGRNYNGPPTNWITPPKSTSDWLQCNTSKVEFAGDIDDQFTHNLKDCILTGSRKDGNGTSTTSPTSIADCAGELSSIAHGRQTINFLPSDDCSHRVTPPDLGISKDLVWDTDLPSTFASQNFSSNPMWFFNTSKNAYSVHTVVPGTGAGKFPKHYSVDCDDNYMDLKKGSILHLKTRMDGNSGTLSCNLGGSNPDHDDGCNPNKVAVRYYHVCGGAGVCEQSNWGVYAPQGENCQEVQCEPNSICCDGYNNECGTVKKNQCETDSFGHSCSNPKSGSTNVQDSLSGCPPLGLYNCNYTIPCYGGVPTNLTEPPPSIACVGKREGDYCEFSVTSTCAPHGSTAWQFYQPSSTSGTCSYPGTSYTNPCTASYESECHTQCIHYTCACHPLGHNGQPCTHLTCKCHDCDTLKYRRKSTTSCGGLFQGSCGQPSGGCTRKGFGGGNLSKEKCAMRPATCNCNSAITCCPGDIYPTNSNCPCNSATTCCPGDTFPTNSNCPPPCDSTIHCCPGDTYPPNPNCAPSNNPICNSATTCCTGDSYPANPNCDPKKVDGECSENGCEKGIKKSGTGANAGDWKCQGLNGGTTTDWCKSKPLCEPNDCSKECCQENKCCGVCKCGKVQYISGPDVVVATCEYDRPMNYINTCPGSGFYQPYIYGPVSATRPVNTRVNYNCVGYTGDYVTAKADNCFYHIERCRSNDGVYPCYRFTHHYGSTGCKGDPTCCSESPCGQ